MASPAEWLELTKLRVEILKLKADEHSWQCYTPKNVRDQLDEILAEINAKLEAHKKIPRRI